MSTRRTKNALQFKCDLCSKQYSKKEHLQRHERSHTGARPYSCKICQRAFSRFDALSRHVKVHGSDVHLKASTYDESPPLPLRRTWGALSTAPSPNTASQQSSMQPPYCLDTNNARLESIFLGPSGEVVLNPVIANDSSYLLWPDSEAFFQTLMSSELLTGEPPFNQPNINEIGQQYAIVEEPLEDNQHQAQRAPSLQGPAASGTGQRALQVVSGIVRETPGAYALPSELSELTPRFLDSSLHMFFTEFIPILPLVHEPTFNFNFAPPLLLSIFTIGSSFLGTDRTVAKSEALWQLTHAALVRSWPNLIFVGMEQDAKTGAQLGLAALLHQIYALLSQNHAIRTSGTTFGALTLQWAERCEIGTKSHRDGIPPIHQTVQAKAHAWNSWVGAEVQLRACLATFIAVSATTQLTGASTTFWLRCMSLPLPADDAVFNANCPEDWISAASQDIHQQRTTMSFSDLSKRFLSQEVPDVDLTIPLQLLELRIVLEILGIMALESASPSPSTLGLPPTADVASALLKLRNQVVSCSQLTLKEKSIALLRWHTVCLETIMRTAKRARHLCDRSGIKSDSFGVARHDNRASDDEVAGWSTNPNGRKSLLHALEISAILRDMPTAATRDIYVVGAVLAAATAYASFASLGVWKMCIPPVVDWKTVLIATTNPEPATANSATTTAFLNGQFDEQQGNVKIHNLIYDLIALRILVKGFSLHWSIMTEVETLIYEWTKRFG